MQINKMLCVPILYLRFNICNHKNPFMHFNRLEVVEALTLLGFRWKSRFFVAHLHFESEKVVRIEKTVDKRQSAEST